MASSALDTPMHSFPPLRLDLYEMLHELGRSLIYQKGVGGGARQWWGNKPGCLEWDDRKRGALAWRHSFLCVFINMTPLHHSQDEKNHSDFLGYLFCTDQKVVSLLDFRAVNY